MLRLFRLFGLLALLGAVLLPAVASAHEHRDVGKYEFTVGFLNEPAYEGEQNGIYLQVVDKASGTPIENLADTLNAQVIFGDQQRDMQLRPAWGEQGVYISNFYPTVAGDYTFRFFGEIEGTPVDERFTSSPEGFNSVEPTSELQFPVQVPATGELSTQLASAQSAVRTATVLGGAGLVVGLVGLIVALLALRSRRQPHVVRDQSAVRT